LKIKESGEGDSKIGLLLAGVHEKKLPPRRGQEALKEQGEKKEAHVRQSESEVSWALYDAKIKKPARTGAKAFFFLG